MSDLNITGEIRDPRGETYVEWQIENYFLLSQKADSLITSPNFHFSNACWNLQIRPNGNRCNKSVEWMSFYIKRLDCLSETFSATITLGIKCGHGKTYAQKSFSYSFEEDIYFGFPEFIRRNELLRNKHVLGDIFTVYCRAKRFSSVAEASTQVYFDGAINLSHDFERLLQGGEKSDLTVQVKKCIFRVHKLILCTRSSVFSAMFQHDMKENSSGVIHIEDCEPDAFHDFLEFVYTGNIKNLPSSNVVSLYSLADKYDLRDLKEICLDYMKDNICLDNVCEVVAVADRHDELELKDSATELIKRNIKTLLPTQKWISFMAENPVLAAKILMTVIPEK